MGGCGAIWGCSEVVGLRNGENVETWRIVAAFAGGVFLIRWLFQIASYCLIGINNSPDSYMTTMLNWLDVLLATVILEVFGAAGAIWGFSQIMLLRTDKTNEKWRIVAITTLIAFTIRWFNIILQFAKAERETTKQKHRDSNVVSKEDFEKQDSEINDLALTETHTLNSRESPSPYQSTPQDDDDV
jgi:hypothetical protein